MLTGKLYKNRIESALFDYELETLNANGEIIIMPDKVINLIRGCIEDEKYCYYLLNGVWYIFEEHFFDKLDEKFKRLFDNIKKSSDKVIKKYGLIKSAVNEEQYNNMFIEDRRIIKVHKHEIKFVELADLIFYDEQNTYLMCNKGVFNGENVRDLENQIYTSSKMLELLQKNNIDLLKEYYNNLDKTEKEKIDEKDFLKLFDKHIVFIAGFAKNYKKDTRSPYAKYLLCELERSLKISGFDLLIINYTCNEETGKAE